MFSDDTMLLDVAKKYYWRINDNDACEEALLLIREMLQRIISLWPREIGQKWNLAKVHEQLHMINDILQNGAPAGFFGGPPEHFLIYVVKNPSIRTQNKNCVLIFNWHQETMNHI